jgi:hypothetical protein
MVIGISLLRNFIQLIWARYTANNLRFQAVSERYQPVSRAAGVFLSLTMQSYENLRQGANFPPKNRHF